MKRLPMLIAPFALSCALPRNSEIPASIPISVTSHNRSLMDVYLLCGDHSAELLGQVHPNEAGFFEIPQLRTHCVQGLNFFLVSRGANRGYWVGPLWPRPGIAVHLTIEKYAGLSSARLLFD